MNTSVIAEPMLLFVDDEENILSSLTRLFRKEGYKIFKATSGKMGLDVLQQQKIGVIISDQRMPEMTGVEFLSQVRHLYPDTVRIVLSGYTDLKSVTDAINEGAIYKFLTKPWDDELLKANVKEAFKYYGLKCENDRLTQQIQQANEELSYINRELERLVDEKTRELTLNLRTLQFSQEILENLPVAVLGVDSEGIVALANRQAHELLYAQGSLIGSQVSVIFPQELSLLLSRVESGTESILSQVVLKEKTMNVYCKFIENNNSARGTIVVFM